MRFKFCFIVATFYSNFLFSLQKNIPISQIKSISPFIRRLKRQAQDNSLARNYLSNYGYLSPNSLHSDSNLAGLVSMRESIREMQTFFGLEVTGELNEETIDLMEKPRCANPDKISINTTESRKKRFVKVGSSWDSNTIKYTIKNFTPKLGKEPTYRAIKDAFEAWAKHAPLYFKEVSSSDNPDINILFAEGFHNDNTAFDGVGGYLAHAYYPGGGIGGDTHFDEAEPWTLYENPPKGNDLFLVAVHELGHALGLAHSMEQDAIMAPVYRHRDTKNFELPQDDVRGIQSLYGSRNARPVPPVSPTTTSPRIPARTTTTTYRYYPRPTRTYRPRPTTTTKTRVYAPTTTEPPLPDVCKLTRFDAVSFLRRELYVFSGQYMWRRQVHDQSMQGPYKITAFWPQLQNGVNAVYENQDTQLITFFKDHMYWEFDGIKLQQGSPRHVRMLGLQNDHVEAAVWWHSNSKEYLFQGSIYWRLNNGRVERNYPKSISVWKNVPTEVDAAFIGVGKIGQNHTYFLKGTSYWKFNNRLVSVVEGPKSFKRDWLKCDDEVEPTSGKRETDLVENEESSSTTIIAIGVVCLVIAITLISVMIYVKRRKSKLQKNITTKLGNGTDGTTKKPIYHPGRIHQPKLSKNNFKNDKKPMMVSTAQQKLRWFRFSLQSQV